MKKKDEAIQELVEKGIYEDSDADNRAYRIVFNSIKKTPTISLSPNFTANVIQKIKHLKEEKSVRKDYIWLAIGLAAFIIATIITIAITNFKFNSGAFTFLNQYGGLLLFGGALIIGLQWLDKRLFQNKVANQ